MLETAKNLIKGLLENKKNKVYVNFSLSHGVMDPEGSCRPFLRAKAAILFWRVFAIAILSVCQSGRRSVCPSHGWISLKRCKYIGSPNLHRRLPERL